MPEVSLPKYECPRCGHKWFPRKEQRPARCAGCKDPYWDKPRSYSMGTKKKVRR